MMIAKLVKLDITYLYLLGAVPVLLYLHGFVLTGTQIFDFATAEGVLAAKQNITVQHDVKEVGEVLETQDERKKEVAETKDANEKFGQAVSLSAKLGAIKDISKKEAAAVVEIAVEEKGEAMSEVATPEPITMPIREVNKALVKPKQQAISTKQPETTQQAPTNKRLVIKRSASILDKKEKAVATVTPTATPTFQSVQVTGKFVESGRITLGKDNTIFVRNTEAFQISSGVTVPRNTVMTGFISTSENKLLINITKVEVGGLHYKTHIAVCDVNGSEGIVLSDINELYKDSQDELDELINGSMDNINISMPMVGSITLPSLRRKDNNQLQVFFDKATKIQLLVKS